MIRTTARTWLPACLIGLFVLTSCGSEQSASNSPVTETLGEAPGVTNELPTGTATGPTAPELPTSPGPMPTTTLPTNTSPDATSSTAAAAHAPPTETTPSAEIAALVGESVDLRATDPNDLTEVPRRLGMSPNSQLYASSPIWGDADGPIAILSAISPTGPAPDQPRTDVLLLVTLDGDRPDSLSGTVVEVVPVELDGGEQLSVVHIGCSDGRGTADLLVGIVGVGPEQIQQPRLAWSVTASGIAPIDPTSVRCELGGFGGPPSSSAQAAG